MFGGTRTSETEEPTFFDHKKWTIYSLKLPTPMTLYKVKNTKHHSSYKYCFCNFYAFQMDL